MESRQVTRNKDVLKAMRERTQVCQGPDTEFVLARESLGVRRANRIQRLHGHTMLELEPFELERSRPGMTEEGHIQASHGASEAGLGP